MKYLCLLSGGHASALCAIWAAQTYGKENCILINHDINPAYEDHDIKRFKKEIANYIGLPITYSNYKNIKDSEKIPDQFDIVMKHGAFTDQSGNALCTFHLKTRPFWGYLRINFPVVANLFTAHEDCIIIYGFDETETDRITRRAGILGAMGYKTEYPIFKNLLKITDTNQIGIKPPATYSTFKHANCIGCLKAGLLHWYVTYCLRPDVYDKGSLAEQEIGTYTIHRVTRNKVIQNISLEELRPIFEQMRLDGIEATEHQSPIIFGHMLRKYQIEQCNVAKPCECTD